MPKSADGENADALTAELSRASLFDVGGKVVVISGGGSGIGAMMAAGFVRNGARVHIFSRKDTAAFAAELTAAGPGACTAHVADAQKPASLAAVASAVSAAEGGRVHVLINNAGTNFNAPLAEYPASSFSKVVDVNLTAVFRVIQLFEPLLRAAATPASPARVINISSMNGIHPPPMTTYAYSTSKAAVNMLSRHLATTLAPDVTVNAVAPGPFRSRMMRGTLAAAGEETVASGTLMRRIGAPADICGAALFLASEAGAWVTGVTLPIEGGSLLASSL